MYIYHVIIVPDYAKNHEKPNIGQVGLEWRARIGVNNTPMTLKVKRLNNKWIFFMQFLELFRSFKILITKKKIAEVIFFNLIFLN